MTKENKNYIRILTGIIIIFLLLCFHIDWYVYATEEKGIESAGLEIPQNVMDKQSGVARLVVYLQDDKENSYYVRQGTGVLIGDAANGQYVVTSNQLIHMDSELLNKIVRQNGLSVEENLTTCVDIVLEVGTTVTVNVGDAKNGEDFVVLGLENNINGVTGLSLGESASVRQNDKLYIMGYGGNEDIFGQTTLSDLNLQQAATMVSAIEEDEITVDYQPESGNIGSPVFDADGYVVGVLLIKEGTLYVKPVDGIKDVLDVLGVGYQGTDTSNHYNEVTDDIAKELNELLLECESLAVQSDVYTKKSIDKLKTAITSAIEVSSKENPTYDEYALAIENMNKYKNKLHKKDYPVRVFQVILLAGILVFLAINIRIKGKIKQLRNIGNKGSGDGIGNVVYAKLIRLDTKQEIPISNVIFRIGQDIEGMDYGIENNTTVSRHHADIMRKGTEFFILDNNSTNHTYVNGEQAMPGEFVKIKGGDCIRLSDVEFVFEV